MDISFDAVFYEPRALEYPLGKAMAQKYGALPWVEMPLATRLKNRKKRYFLLRTISSISCGMDIVLSLFMVTGRRSA